MSDGGSSSDEYRCGEEMEAYQTEIMLLGLGGLHLGV